MQISSENTGEHIDSYYANSAGVLPKFPTLNETIECDVAVIGAGFAGLTTALELAKGGKSVALLEANRIGWAASGRNGGFVSAGFAQSIFSIEQKIGLHKARQLYQLSQRGQQYVKTTIQSSGADDIIAGNGWLKLVRYDDKGQLQKRSERLARDYGVEQQYISPAMLPNYVASDRYFAGLCDPDPFHIHPLKYAALLAKLASKRGVKIFEQSKVTKLIKAGAGWIASTQKGTIECQHVVLATSAGDSPYKKVNNAILPVATYVLAAEVDRTQVRKSIPFKGCIADDRRAGDYYRVVEEGGKTLLIWGGRITTRTSKPADLENMLIGDVQSTYPELTKISPITAWMGHMGYTNHKMPIIGLLERGLWVVTAFGGHGLAPTAMGGLVIAEAITGQSNDYELFNEYKAMPIGMPGFKFLGRMGTQLEYWRLQFMDRLDEGKSRIN